MTDKEQIIIDETQCKDYDNGCCKGSCCLNSVSIVNSCDPQNMRCDFYVNKLEEQLALKTQELTFARNEVHSKTEYIKEQRDIIDQLKQKYEQLKEDCTELEREGERLKSYGATLLADKNAMEIGRDDYMQRCKQLEQECEELKDARFNLNCEIYSLNRYRKALEEIEQELKEDIYCESQECGCDDFEECLRCTKDLILDIINKVKGENNVQ